MAKKYANFFIARLSSDISASDVEIPVTDLPKDDDNNVITEGKLVIDAKRPDKREVIGFTGVDGPKLIGVTRGLGRTIATTHQRNATIEMTVLGSDLTEVHHAAETISDLPTYTREQFADNVVRGTGEITTVSGREASISDITYYMSGIRLTKTGIPNKTFTASRNTYCYIDTVGAVSYIETPTSAAAPATPANSIPFAKVTTNASTITAVVLMSRRAVPSFEVTLGSSQSIPVTTYEKLNFNQIQHDTTGSYNTSLSSYTVPESGVYLITITVGVGAGDGGASAVYVNGSRRKRSYYTSAPSGTYTPITTITKLDAGDVVEAYIYSLTVVTASSANDQSYFSGVKVA